MMDINTFNVIKIIIVVVLFVVVTLLIRQSRAIKLEKRIGSYGIDPINKKYNSILDNVRKVYNKFVIKNNKILRKSVFLTRVSKRYEKHAIYNGREDAMDYITNKIVIGVIFTIIYIVSNTFRLKSFGFYQLLIIFVIGYYMLDIYLAIYKKRKSKLVKEQMLRAIIIMNNAFKAGKSTLQAIEIASNELNSPLNVEFKKMYEEMKYGLSVEVVFDRFAKRIDTEEASYIASSLVILNRTGGNIIKIFSSIEKTLFEKKKLNDELKNLTVSSNMLVKILTFVPIVFIIVIYILNPSYFNPLFTSILGYMIIFVILLMFILYVFVLNRVMKVKV